MRGGSKDKPGQNFFFRLMVTNFGMLSFEICQLFSIKSIYFHLFNDFNEKLFFCYTLLKFYPKIFRNVKNGHSEILYKKTSVP